MTRTRLPDALSELAVLDAGFERAVEALRATRDRLPEAIIEAADRMTATFVRERTVLVAGNGGSAAQALHLAAELVGRFKVPGRPGLPVIPLCADTATLTAWANDVGFDDVFARGVEAFGRPGDLLVGLSTSGRSPNLVRAFEAAGTRGLDTLALLGGDGGDLLGLADHAIVIPSSDTQAIQDVHSTVVHLLCELVEARLAEGGWFGASRPASPRLRAVGAGRRAVAPQRRAADDDEADGAKTAGGTGGPAGGTKRVANRREAGRWTTR